MSNQTTIKVNCPWCKQDLQIESSRKTFPRHYYQTPGGVPMVCGGTFRKFWPGCVMPS